MEEITFTSRPDKAGCRLIVRQQIGSALTVVPVAGVILAVGCVIAAILLRETMWLPISAAFLLMTALFTVVIRCRAGDAVYRSIVTKEDVTFTFSETGIRAGDRFISYEELATVCENKTHAAFRLSGGASFAIAKSDAGGRDFLRLTGKPVRRIRL